MNKYIEFSVFTLVFSLLVPRFYFFGVGVGIEDILCLFFALYLFFNIKSKKLFFLVRPVISLALFVLIYVPYGILQSYSYLGDIVIPTEIWQYFKRFLVFCATSFFLINGSNAQFKKIAFCLVFAFFLYQMIGVVQISGGPLADWLSSIYSRSDHQYNTVVRDFNKRVFGVSGFSTSWGGFSVFTMLASLYFVFSKDFGRRFSLFCVVVSFLSLINVVYSGSRGALFSAVFGLFVLFVLYIYRNPPRVIKFIPVFVIVFPSAFYLLSLFVDEAYLDFILYRFDVLIEEKGGSRIDQIFSGIDLVNSYYEYIMGVSNAFQRFEGVYHGIEVEPVNIFVNYGVLGLFLIYFPFLYFFFIIKANRVNEVEVFFLRSILLSYLVFSMGYFFYAEIVVGVLPWVFLGYVYARFVSFRVGSKC